MTTIITTWCLPFLLQKCTHSTRKKANFPFSSYGYFLSLNSTFLLFILITFLNAFCFSSISEMTMAFEGKKKHTEMITTDYLPPLCFLTSWLNVPGCAEWFVSTCWANTVLQICSYSDPTRHCFLGLSVLI